MYVGLFVKDECERSMKNQASKDELVEFATSSREVTCEKATCKAYVEAEESYQVVKFVSVSREGSSHEEPTKLSIWQKVYLLY